ncbi:hypothetical protein CON94_22760 [Bacillus pseudomycoides]|uniref:hypothetical protein n=1 Tax=Bacillus pseudomycoides TaxID=64104 RepID=UPI000BED7AAC|nr:hypothetical protein [Bacillus pseudomycoides]PEF73172.1 hypothetical protein CON94_22760 [Bacillus pseudomycoides]PEL79725.1 hypothetical protein CN615_24980 [Bacillus pseudomycoides]
MSTQVKAICFLSIRPFLNRSLFHNPLKPLIWGMLIIISLPFVFQNDIDNILENATTLDKIAFLITESIILGMLKSFNDLPKEMYSRKLITSLFISGVSPYQIIIGQWLSRSLMYAAFAFIISIPFTHGYSIGTRILYGFLFFIISFSIEMLVNLIGRYIIVILMYYAPRVVRLMVVFATIINFAVVIAIVYGLFHLGSITVEVWAYINKLALYCSVLMGIITVLSLLFTKKIGDFYYEGWLKFSTAKEKNREVINERTVLFQVKDSRSAIIMKDFVILWNQNMTKARIVIWLMGSVVVGVLAKVGILDSLLMERNLNHYIMAFSVIFVILMLGELITYLYQQEGISYNIYVITETRGVDIYIAKVVNAILFFIVPMVVTYIGLAAFLNTNGSTIVFSTLNILVIGFCTLFIQLSFSALARAKTNSVFMTNSDTDDNVDSVIEQTPKGIWFVSAVFIGLISGVIGIGLIIFEISTFIFLFYLFVTVPFIVLGIRQSSNL